MKLRLHQLTTSPTYRDLPEDLDGYAITLDISHCDADQLAILDALIIELRRRGAARVVIAGMRREITGGRPTAQAA
ncbi:MAG: hypothetical protein GX542_00420 [Rhodococcus sp.]|nr:hypothetical protein [Rhodococcus sp. (in: high G+C Gram-positive bacteria)]